MSTIQTCKPATFGSAFTAPVMLAALVLTPTAFAQSSSLLRWSGQRPPAGAAYAPDAAPAAPLAPFAAVAPHELSPPATHALEATSFIAISPLPPRKFKVHDLITIIVRQQKTYQADGKLDNKNKWDISGKLSEWFRFYDETHLGSDKLSNGQPSFKFNYDNKYKQESLNDRNDKFSTYITANVIDVKPNGNLALEAKLREQHDEEEFTITLTGTCRSEDVSPDNSILSTKVADLVLEEKNHGAVRDATKRGWIPRLLDWGKTF